jgi:hypothetical protein
MLGHLAYLAALSAPDIATASAEGAKKLVEETGRRLAAGMIDELSAKLKTSGGPVFGAAIGALGGISSLTVETFKEDMARRCADVLKDEGVAIVAAEELRLLRDLATTAAKGGDLTEGLRNLMAFHETGAQD